MFKSYKSAPFCDEDFYDAVSAPTRASALTESDELVPKKRKKTIRNEMTKAIKETLCRKTSGNNVEPGFA